MSHSKKNQDSERIIGCLRDILSFLAAAQRIVNRGYPEFRADPDNLLGLALESLIIKIGEAVSRLPLEFQAQQPHVPWRIMKEMRNRLSHNYENTNYEIIWETAVTDFPEVHRRIDEILSALHRQ